MHPYASEHPDFAMRPLLFLLRGACPWRRPKLDSALAGHQRVIAELHRCVAIASLFNVWSDHDLRAQHHAGNPTSRQISRGAYVTLDLRNYSEMIRTGAASPVGAGVP